MCRYFRGRVVWYQPGDRTDGSHTLKSWEDWRPPVRRLLEVFESARHDCGAGEIGGDVDVVELLQSSLCSLIDRESTRAVATIRNSLVVFEDKLLVEAVESNFELSVEIGELLAVYREADTVVVVDGTVCRNQFNIDWTIAAACRN